ncbi:MAG: chain length determinant protein EpsF [Methylophilaceae bacterium]|jgi:succinoglycan biosynthesis transport protein ExoP|nr:chain length determinant protein EpsF [Methylophilaceae bacterium]
MNLTLLLLMLRARLKIVLATFLITVLTATAVSLMMPKYYRATTQVVLSYTGVDTVTGSPLLAATMPGFVQTQIDIIKNRSVALKVVDDLQLTSNATMREAFQDATEGRGSIRDWIANRLMARLDVDPSADSSVLSITYEDKESRMAADVTNAFARSYRDLSTQLKVEPAQYAADYFSKQAKSLRDNLERAQNKLSEYQQKNGITSADEKLDVEVARLNDLSQQLVMAQSMAIEARSRQAGAGIDSPDVAQSPVVQSLRIDEGKAASKLAELSERLGSNHPQYIAAQAELSKIRGELSRQISSASNSISGNARIHERREADLRAQVAMQKAKVLEVNRTRDELSVLKKDVEMATKAMDTTAQRFTETSMEGQSNHSDVSLLSPALPPGMPASPKVGLNIALSMVLGLLLGTALGLILELLDRRVRSSNDVANLLRVPVISLIQERPTVTGMRMLPGPTTGRYLPST